MLKAAKTVATKHADTASVSDASHGPFSVEDYRNVLAEAKDYIRFINASDYSVVVSHIDLILSSPPIFLPSDPPPSQHSRGLVAFAKAVVQVAFEGGELSGSDIQEMGVEHGLLTCEPFDPAKHKDPKGYAEEGDYWYVYAGPLTTEGQP